MEVKKPMEAVVQLPKKTLETGVAQNSPPPPPHLPQSPPSEDKGLPELKPEAGGVGVGEQKATKSLGPTKAAVEAAATGSATDIQKKIRRAERFGVPVQLSEEDKRNSRAERFGTGNSPQGTLEEQKRKARAERFGSGGDCTADAELKKKARLARFLQNTSVSSLEEEKRKARAIRFSQVTPNTPSQTSGDAGSGQTLGVSKTIQGT